MCKLVLKIVNQYCKHYSYVNNNNSWSTNTYYHRKENYRYSKILPGCSVAIYVRRILVKYSVLLRVVADSYPQARSKKYCLNKSTWLSYVSLVIRNLNYYPFQMYSALDVRPPTIIHVHPTQNRIHICRKISSILKEELSV